MARKTEKKKVNETKTRANNFFFRQCTCLVSPTQSGVPRRLHPSRLSRFVYSHLREPMTARYQLALSKPSVSLSSVRSEPRRREGRRLAAVRRERHAAKFPGRHFSLQKSRVRRGCQTAPESRLQIPAQMGHRRSCQRPKSPLIT